MINQHLYPIGGGTVGDANPVFARQEEEKKAAQGQSMVSPELAQAMMKKFGTTGGGAGGTTATKGGMQSALGGGGGGSAMGSASTWVAPAVAMAGLVKAGDKLKIGAKDQAHMFSKALKKFTGMF